MVSRSGTVFLLAALLPVAGCDRQAASPAQANAAAATTSDEVMASAVAVPAGSVDRSHKGEVAPATVFEAPDGKPARLSQFRGKPLLVNLWATWCAPCVAELPTLDRAAADAGGRITVLAVSQDMDIAKVAPFLAGRHLRHLAAYRDPKLGLSVGYGVNLPTTLFYDAKGRELWRVSGGFDWSGPKAAILMAER